MANEELLQEFNSKIIRNNGIVFVYLFIVLIMGIAGNTVSFVFYGLRTRKKTVTNFLIAALALNDLVASIVSVDIFVLYFFYVTFRNDVLCKIYFLLGHSFTVISILLLVVIGIQRYLRICLTNAKYQMTKNHAKLLTTVIVIYCVLNSSRNFVISGVITVPYSFEVNKTVIVYICTFTKTPDLQNFVFAFRIYDCIVFFVSNATLISVYILIVRKIRQVGTAFSVGQKCTTGKVTASRDIQMNATGSGEQCRIGNGVGRSHGDANINIMLLMTTFASIVSFIPYFVLELFDTDIHSFEYGPFKHLAHRSWLLNSSINPYIMLLFHADLRRFVKSHICTCNLTAVNTECQCLLKRLFM